MKYLYLIVFIIVGSVLHSQNYEAKYKHFGDRKGQGVLSYNSSNWKYDFFYNLEMSISSDDVSTEEFEETSISDSSFYYSSLKDNYYLCGEPLISEETFKRYMCVIKGDLIKPDWNIISDSTKKIGDYVCTLAECDLCGWKIKAWFTPDIPVSCGPWRLWGLPGLIMNANSEDGDIDIQIVSVKEVSDSPKKPKVKKTVSLEEYKVLREKALKKIERTYSSMQKDRTATFSFNAKPIIWDKCLK